VAKSQHSGAAPFLLYNMIYNYTTRTDTFFLSKAINTTRQFTKH